MSAGRPSCSTTSYTRAVGTRAKVEDPPGRRPVQVQRQLHPRERVRHVQARQVIRHPHPPTPRGRLPGECHLRLRCQLIPGLRKQPGDIHCPYGWLPGRASGDQGWAGAGDALRDPPGLLQRLGDATDMPGMRSQAGLARVPGVTPGCIGQLVRAGRNRYPAAGRG